MQRMEMIETGSATANQRAQSNLGSIASRAIKFCGEEIGELWPPMFAASAMASWGTNPGSGSVTKQAGRGTHDRTGRKG